MNVYMRFLVSSRLYTIIILMIVVKDGRKPMVADNRHIIKYI